MLKRLLLVLLLTVPAFAATHYVDCPGGADTNNGTATGTPWAHAPGMAGCASSCASYTPAAGDFIKFKGGVICTLSGGWTASNGGSGGGGFVTFGADPAWFTGGTWAKPIINANGQCKAITLSADYLAVSDMELKGTTITGSCPFGSGTVGFSGVQHIHLTNLYIHGCTRSGISSDDFYCGVIGNTFGGVSMLDTVADNVTVDNSDGTGGGDFGSAFRQVYEVKNSTITNIPDVAEFIALFHDNTIHDIPLSFDVAAHTNVVTVALWDGTGTAITTTAYVYRNKVWNVHTGTNFYLEPCFGNNDGTIYAYDNIFYNNLENGPQPFLLDSEQGTGNCGTIFLYNNTIVQNLNNSVLAISHGDNHACTTSPCHIKAVTYRNNHIITDTVSPVDLTNVQTVTGDHNPIQTLSAASAQGYTTGNSFKPTSASGGSVDQGTSVTCVTCSSFTVDFLNVSRPQNGIWDAGAYEFTTGGVHRRRLFRGKQ